jgi:hypothetical protein
MSPRADDVHPLAARLVLPAWCALLTLAVLAPVLSPGFVLSFDMVFSPRHFLVPDALGIGTAPPRAVPVDALVATLTAAIPGALLQKLVLLALLLFAGLGASRLIPEAPLSVRMIAATTYVWNPYVAERLVIGHWALLVAYAGLPWLVRCALVARGGGPLPLARLVVVTAVCSVTPSGGLLAALVVVIVMCLPATSWRARGPAALMLVVVNAPWWLPGLLQGLPLTVDGGGVAAFAARADTRWGDLGSLLGLGGIWNALVVPDSRDTWFAAAALVVVLTLAAVGMVALANRDRHLLAVLTAMGVLGLGLAAVGTFSEGRNVLETLTANVPGAGLLRDGQKFVALLAPLETVCFGMGAKAVADLLARRARTLLGSRAVLAGALMLPLVVLPDLAWGAGGRLEAVSYPADWNRVRQVLLDQPEHGDVLVLPWSAFRKFEWNDGRTSLDPAARFLPVTVVGSTDLLVGDQVVRGDDPRSARVGRLLHSGEPLRLTMPAQGIGWVLVEQRTPGPPIPAGLLTGARERAGGPSVHLFQLPGVVAAPAVAHRRLVTVVDLLVLLMILGCGATSFRRGRAGPLLS